MLRCVRPAKNQNSEEDPDFAGMMSTTCFTQLFEILEKNSIIEYLHYYTEPYL